MELRSVFFLLFLSLVPSCLFAAPLATPSHTYKLLESFENLNASNARKAWFPMRGTAPVSLMKGSSGKTIKMPCDFQGTKIQRASWDLTVDLDLTMCNGIQFSVFCSNSTPISGFTLYMKSGDGWYSHSFSVEKVGAWNLVKIEKSETGIEGTPSGWGKITEIRISAWRGKDLSTEFYIANLGFLGGDATIAIVRAESAILNNPDEAESAKRYAGNVAQVFKTVGIPFVMVADLDVTAARLKEKKIVVLPHNPGMPASVVSELKKYVKNGGKLISFYGLPRELRELAGISSGNFIRCEYPGQFSSMRFNSGIIKGAPPIVKQSSWNIQEFKPLKGRSRIAALWYDEQGKETGRAAVLVSDNCIVMTHILLLDDITRKREMMLAMTGHFEPAIWKHCTRRSIEEIAKIASYENFNDALKGIRAQMRIPQTEESLNLAAELRQKAKTLYSKGEYSEAIHSAANARKALVEAYCYAQKPSLGEHRAWWCHSAFGVAGMNWDQAVKLLADNGFTAIIPNMLWGGTAYYDSQVLPVNELVKTKGDQIALCLKACKKYGIECHVWKVNWYIGRAATKEFMDEMKKAGRTQVLFDATLKERWLCPSHPDNQKLEIDSMVEVVEKYDVDGIHFDYIRYPGNDSCFCEGCRQRLEKKLGRKVEDWPSDCRKNAEIKRKWLEFRRSNITKVVAAVSEKVRRIKPNIKISAAVFRNWPVDRDNVGQDWKLWCDKGYLDFVCPMDYTSSNTQFENMVKSQTKWAGAVPCYPGIGVSCWKPSNDISKLIEQIKITRKLNTGGFTIFNYAKSEADTIVPLCGKGITKREKVKK